MAIIMDGEVVSTSLLKAMLADRDSLRIRRIRPTVEIIRVGKKKDALAYETAIKKMFKKIEIRCLVSAYPEEVSQDKLVMEIKKKNEDNRIHGILILRPLPEQLDEYLIGKCLDPTKDSDGMTPYNLGNSILENNSSHLPCTPIAVLEMLSYYQIKLVGQRVLVIGQSAAVGKPLTVLLLNRGATVTTANIYTKDLKKSCLEADVIISATGKKGLIKKEYVPKGCVVIDVGISVDAKGNVSGDVCFDDVKEQCSYITPVPGGIGLITTTVLARNVLSTALNESNKQVV
ncbi:bifunctional 5,10-methylenetetrahydrofolate dehydrogenase/5,10-methenyltetrahydrofolate cyclohydrolase [Carnobacterium sp. TMP28]|uniref:bifunctional 5,10-methylenetetrahydrofolate dehydrogenase/5,10-methenyltetrahydrofolate cyclohydrolase n=1 Tax=Carnobacterium sp. TMP28 TaxID=3397060 RepID=UPI0039E060FD